ncbi:MAG TPA: high-potential iron-sulfur protein [Rubricoccaceae bacterium]|nr:high-potential iron-sulfur protein [Rubricoccaceae bacterium]
MSDPLSRRTFLGRLAALGAVAPTLLTACGGGDGADSLVVEAATCRGYDPASAPIRESLGYVDRSATPGQFCNNCRFYTAPAGAGDRCGLCQVIPGLNGQGPVSPGGYCRSWAAAPAPA